MARVGQRVRDFQGGHGAHLPVVVPARGDGVDVRSEQQRRQAGVGTRAPADQIPREVDRDVEPGFPHEGRHPLASGEVGVAVGDPADPSRGDGPEAGQIGERSAEAVPVHQQVGYGWCHTGAAHQWMESIWMGSSAGAGGQPPDHGRHQAEREPS